MLINCYLPPIPAVIPLIMAKRLPTIMTRTTIHSGYSEKLTQVSHDDICAEATPIVSNNREAH